MVKSGIWPQVPAGGAFGPGFKPGMAKVTGAPVTRAFCNGGPGTSPSRMGRDLSPVRESFRPLGATERQPSL